MVSPLAPCTMQNTMNGLYLQEIVCSRAARNSTTQANGLSFATTDFSGSGGDFECGQRFRYPLMKHSRKFRSTGELFERFQTITVCTSGRPGGSLRNTSPGRFTSAMVSVAGATPNPAEISHILE